MGMVGKKAGGETDLVTDKKPKTQTEETRSHHKAAMEPREPGTGKRKRQGQGGGDQHNSGDGPDAENQQVQTRPLRIMDGAQHQQSYGGGTRQAVNDANEQRAQGVKKPQAFKWPTQPTRRREAGAVMVRGRGMRMPVKMYAGVMLVEVGMVTRHARVSRGGFFGDPLRCAAEVEQAQQNQHQANGKFNGQAGARRNCPAK